MNGGANEAEQTRIVAIETVRKLTSKPAAAKTQAEGPIACTAFDVMLSETLGA
jgi:hypothetical protein